jgi:hypothetical protein
MILGSQFSIVSMAASAFIWFAASSPAPAQAVPEAPVTQIKGSGMHLQKSVTMGCSAGECRGTLDGPKTDQFLRLDYLSCVVFGGSKSIFEHGYLALGPTGDARLTQYIGHVASTSNGSHTLSQPLNLVLKQGQVAEIALILSDSPTPISSCVVTGAREKL